MEDAYVVVSYHYNTDRPYVGWLAQELEKRQSPCWFLDDLSDPQTMTTLRTDRDDRYPTDWRAKLQNWQATWLEHVVNAAGVIVVTSQHSKGSESIPGRGMWREKPAIDFLREDDPLRVWIHERPRSPRIPPPDNQRIVAELVAWSEKIFALPPVFRAPIEDSGAPGSAWNTPEAGVRHWMHSETKTAATDWYELVRLDLYDVQWHCRRCGLKSANFIMGEEIPPHRCPRCGHGTQS